jgi:hypothetical protein
MFRAIEVVGRGRLGSALAARLAALGLLADQGGDLIVFSVPDAAIHDAAAGRPTGPWVAHVSGATPLGALAPTNAASACTRSRHLSAREAPSSSTAPGPR